MSDLAPLAQAGDREKYEGWAFFEGKLWKIVKNDSDLDDDEMSPTYGQYVPTFTFVDYYEPGSIVLVEPQWEGFAERFVAAAKEDGVNLSDDELWDFARRLEAEGKKDA